MDKLNILQNHINIWDKNRQEIRVGRIARALLVSSKSNFIDREIELFVNSYKAAVDKFNDKFAYFEEVKGADITTWYESNRSTSGGTLGSSCMRSAGTKLQLYAESENVSLLIYKSPDDENKILGRAILWTLVDGKKFLDRIYTTRDSDVNLFIEYAKEEKYYYRNQYHSISFNGESSNITPISQVKKNLEKFPYVDTLCWYNYTNGLISNDNSALGEGILFSLQRTDGCIDEGYCTGCRSRTVVPCNICEGGSSRLINRLSEDEDYYDDDYYDYDDD
jgi:hypothetical protein